MWNGFRFVGAMRGPRKGGPAQFLTPMGGAHRVAAHAGSAQYFVERMEELVGARSTASASTPTLRPHPTSQAAPAHPAVSAQVRSLLDDAYRRIAEALLAHLLDAEADRTNPEEKAQRHVHVFIAGTRAWRAANRHRHTVR